VPGRALMPGDSALPLISASTPGQSIGSSSRCGPGRRNHLHGAHGLSCPAATAAAGQRRLGSTKVPGNDTRSGARRCAELRFPAGGSMAMRCTWPAGIDAVMLFGRDRRQTLLAFRAVGHGAVWPARHAADRLICGRPVR
jgi:hypothetical protein